LLEAIDLTVHRGDRRVFAGLRFAVSGGHCLQVVGDNGSGKTTLLRTLAGLLEADQGEVRWNGQRADTRSLEFQRDFVYLGHQPPLKDDLTGRENLRFGMALRSALPARGGEPAIDAALAEVGAAALGDRPVRSLSTGQRRRIALAALRLTPARIWLLDEPVTNLDAAGQGVVASMVAMQLDSGGVVVAATHQDLGVAPERCPKLRLGGRA
jgi:heme exporter protein A